MNHEKISKKKNSIYAIAIKRAVTPGANRHSLTFTDAVKIQDGCPSLNVVFSQKQKEELRSYSPLYEAQTQNYHC